MSNCSTDSGFTVVHTSFDYAAIVV